MHSSRIALLLSLWIALLSSPAPAQSQGEIIEELVTRTIDTCVGPRALALDGLEEALELLADAPARSCLKACRAAGRSCLKIVKNEDKCGKIFLKGVARTASAICSDSFCRSSVKHLMKTALSSYVGAGDAERLLCVQDQITCQQVCTP